MLALLLSFILVSRERFFPQGTKSGRPPAVPLECGFERLLMDRTHKTTQGMPAFSRVRQAVAGRVICGASSSFEPESGRQKVRSAGEGFGQRGGFQ